MRIGIDFDNTIARYDHVFPSVAEAEGLLAIGTAGSKHDVRDALRARGPDGEILWQRLQGLVYGKHMQSAALFDGVGAFLDACKARLVPVCIVSHKTRFGHHDPEQINLRDAAWTWMQNRHFFEPDGYAINESNVYFESTRDEKIARIRQLGCSHFIDDLEEVLREPGFPEDVRRILFAPEWSGSDSNPFCVARSWQDVQSAVFETSDA